MASRGPGPPAVSAGSLGGHRHAASAVGRGTAAGKRLWAEHSPRRGLLQVLALVEGETGPVAQLASVGL